MLHCNMPLSLKVNTPAQLLFFRHIPLFYGLLVMTKADHRVAAAERSGRLHGHWKLNMDGALNGVISQSMARVHFIMCYG